MMCSLPLTGDTLFQMAEVHRQIQVQLEDVVRPEEPELTFLLAGSERLGVLFKPFSACFSFSVSS